MDREERRLTEAAVSLTVEDFHYLQEHKMVPDHVEERGAIARGPAPRSGSAGPRKKGKRHRVKHEWPEVGTILEADYHGVHCEAEVIAAPRYKSGKVVKILTGRSAEEICSSMSGAMLKATEAQREEQGLGKRGVTNGWTFWEAKKQPPR